jgi:hypothetical protein
MAKRRRRMWVAGSKKHPICCAGPPDDDVCHNLSLLEATESDFHNGPLIEATRDINRIFLGLRELPPDDHPPDTELSLLNTSLGLLLVWAEPSGRPPGIDRLVTYNSPEPAIREALGLPNESAGKSAHRAEA